MITSGRAADRREQSDGRILRAARGSGRNAGRSPVRRFRAVARPEGRRGFGGAAACRVVPLKRQRRLVAVRPAARSRRLCVRSGAGEARGRSPYVGCAAIWIEDAVWVEAALQDTGGNAAPISDKTDPCAFEELFTSLVAQADARLWSGLDARVGDNLNEAARASLRLALLRELSSLGTAALYERFAKARNASSPQHDAPAQHNGGSIYHRFVAEMQAGGWRRLFEDKPVLLRLFAIVTRQWIETSREMVLRLDADLAVIRRDILHSGNAGRVAGFEGNLSDPHNHGRSVRIVSFEDGARRRLQAEGFAARCRLARLGRTLERRASADRAESRARDRAGRLRLDRIHRSRGVRQRGRFRAVFPARRRLAGAVSLLCRNRHASGEHDRLRRSPGADRSGNDSPSRRRRAQRRSAGRSRLRRRRRNRQQFRHGGRPASRLWPLSGQHGLRHRRHDRGLERQNGNHLGQNQFRRDAAGEIEPSRQDQPKPAARQRPQRQVRRSRRRFRLRF